MARSTVRSVIGGGPGVIAGLAGLFFSGYPANRAVGMPSPDKEIS